MSFKRRILKRALTGDISCFNILADAFSFVHEKDADHIDIPRLEDTAWMGLKDDQKEEVLGIISH